LLAKEIMKNSSILLITFVLFSLSLFINSCKKNKDKNCKIYNVSSSSKSSHNNGQNCIDCHTYGGKGEGCFNVAGSMYNSSDKTPMVSGYISLYTEASGKGTLKAKINVDQSGNFYSSDIGEVSGLYASITGPKGEVRHMSQPLTTGACTSCHGNSTAIITAN
jgi:hypothetical protein